MKNIRGATRFTLGLAKGLSQVVEQMHETIARNSGAFRLGADAEAPAHGESAQRTYKLIRAVNDLLGEGVDRSLAHLDKSTQATLQSKSPLETKMVAALNGAFGDYLEESENPLAIEMNFSTPEKTLTLSKESISEVIPEASDHVVVLVHGLCFSDRQWSREDVTCMGQRLQQELGYTPIYLNYNSGRHISTNGKDFANRLELLLTEWPVPIASLSLIGHSMGGLLIRSACWYANEFNHAWLAKLQRVACLGTPHHGAPLEKMGNFITAAMKSFEYVDPLAFGKYRSAGIKDLRYGNLLDEDWLGHPEDSFNGDTRRLVPLLPGVNYYFAVAAVGEDKSDLKNLILGDLLVRLDSATGDHHDNLRKLHVKPENCRRFSETNHLDLLYDKKVHDQMVEWFA